MRTRTRTILSGLVLAAALASGVAWATIPEATGTIQGCYTTSKGSLRVVDSADECRNFETAISWNQKGSAGANGTDGKDGEDGSNGANGIDGVAGTPGAKGDPGAAGTNGINGGDGKAGAPGADGVSVTNEALSPGNPACVNGGSKFTAANGTSYACNGAPGTGLSGSAVTETVIPNGAYSVILDSSDLGTYMATCYASYGTAIITLEGRMQAPDRIGIARAMAATTLPVFLYGPSGFRVVADRIIADSILLSSVGYTGAGALAAIGEFRIVVFNEQQSPGTYACKVVSQLTR